MADWEAEISRLYIQGSQELDEVKRKDIYAQTQRLTQEYLLFTLNGARMPPLYRRSVAGGIATNK